MKKSFLSFFFLIIPFLFRAQVVVTEPPLPIDTQPVTVIFDATQGSGGLAGYTGDVYAHTGVITNLSTSGSDWKYVKTNWGENTPETKLTRIGQDLYSLQVNPSIRSYYGVPVSEQILKMAFVFRSSEQVGGIWLEGKTETGGDIFVDVFESGLSVTFSQPTQFPLILQLNESFITEVNANEADTLSLFVDGNLMKKVAGNTLKDTLTADDFGKYLVKTVAKNATNAVADSFYYHVRPDVVVEPLPAGVRDGINYIDDQTVILSIFAPHKEFIYVIGDFSDWDLSTDNFMKMTPDNNRFWIQINNLVPGKEYIFQYFIDGQLKLGDPYADKVSDPWNDSYISNTTYPGLIQYPAGKTTGIATVLQTNQVPYNWEVENFIPPKETDLVVYELLVRDFTSKHSYTALIDSLDYIENLGVNAIELLPVNEFEGNISWGYNVSWFFAPDKYYGPKNELKRFIDECHKRGIAVFVDMVLNHAYNQCVFVQMYFDGSKPTTQNPWFNVQSNFTNPSMQFGNDFNHESIYTQNLVDSINSYWMSEYKVDGFRFDLTKGFSNTPHGNEDPWGSNYDANRVRLLKRMADQIWARKADTYVIFEHLANNDEEKVLADYGILLWGKMTEKYAEGAMGYNDGGKSDLSWISYQQRNWNDPHVVGYMESHDEERIAFKCLTYGNSQGDYKIKETTTYLRRIALDAVFFLTIPGPKMIWQFGELGYDYSIDYNGRVGPKPVPWGYLSDYRRKYLSDFYGALIKLRTEYPVFETETYTLDVYNAIKRIILTSSDMNVVILGNFDVNSGSVHPGFTHLGTWYDYFTGEPYEVTDLAANHPLEAGEYKLYTDVQLPVPQINTAISEHPDQAGYISAYPNPGRDFTFDFDLQYPAKVDLQILDLSGRSLSAIYSGQLDAGQQSLHWSSRESRLAPGMYLLRYSIGSHSGCTRLIIL